ncbi:hypothetical protein HK405_015474, partial [Cladochytrium tenue]
MAFAAILAVAATTAAASAGAAAASAANDGNGVLDRSQGKWGLDVDPGASLASSVPNRNDDDAQITSPVSECVPIDSTLACSPWTSGLYINLTQLNIVYGLQSSPLTTASAWDALVTTLTSGGKAQAALWQDHLGCSGYNGEPVQYHRTYTCLTDIMYFSAGCNAAYNARVPYPPLCGSTCGKYGEAVAGLVDDTAECPTAASNIVNQRRSDVIKGASSCNFVVTQWSDSLAASGIDSSGETNCNTGVYDDAYTCGFGGNAEAAETFCNSVSDLVPCCKDYRGALETGYAFRNNSVLARIISNAATAAATRPSPLAQAQAAAAAGSSGAMSAAAASSAA